MYELNIWLDKADKKKLNKMAFAKFLSLSTYIDIIVSQYYWLANVQAFNNYIHKGEQQTHLKLLNKNNLNLNPTIVTNAIYLYLYNNKHPEYEKMKEIFKNINRKIQSESDKKTDNRWLGNYVIRSNYYETQRK